jgi:hypothetical protein
VYHNKKLHDLGGSLQGQEARGRPDRKGRDNFPEEEVVKMIYI